MKRQKTAKLKGKARNTFKRQAERKAKIALAPQLPNSDMSMRQTQT